MFAIWQDLRFGARLLLKNHGITLIVILTLALGIGANAAILSTVNGFILRPLPATQPEQLVRPYQGNRRELEVWGRFSYPEYLDLLAQNRVFSGLLACQQHGTAISDSASREGNDGVRGEAIWGEAVSGNYFDVLGIRPVLGRSFLPEEDRTPGTHPVVVLGYAIWQRRYYSDPSIIGKTIYLHGQPYTIIGVAPPKHEGLDLIRQGFWIPLMMQTRFGYSEKCLKDYGCRNLNLLGRLKSGTTMKQSEADLNLIAENWGRIYPNTHADRKIKVVSEVHGRWMSDYGSYRFTSVIALAVTGLVLLVACANVANLLLARAGARSREIGIRLAIGAGRLRVMRQLLIESLLLACLGGGIGIIFAFWANDLIAASIPPFYFPIKLDFGLDLLVLKWMLLIMLLTGIIFGLAPALIAARTDLTSVLKGGGAGRLQHNKVGRWTLRNLLVVVQVAISIIVLVCAGLFLRSLSRAQQVDPGFSTDSLITMHFRPGAIGYNTADGKRFFNELLSRIGNQPGVRAASLAATLFLGGSNYQDRGPILKEGDPLTPPNERLFASANVVAPKYFETMRTPLLLGRDFTERDNENAPRVAIVNQEFARRLYGSEQNALGKRIRANGQNSPLLEIIGIAQDGRYVNFYESQRACIFLPKDQEGNQSRMILLVSAVAATELKSVVESVQREIKEIDSRVPAFGLQMGDQNLASTYWAPRMAAGLATAFGLLVLVLATTGLYSVMSYTVSRRTREIGIRQALGAQGRDIFKIVVWQGLILVIAGMVSGLIGALALTRLLSSLLFGISASDPLTFVGVAALLVLVALMACYIPARRATRVDPIAAIRSEG
jgi:predicted permease